MYRRIHHVAIVVRSLEQALSVYRDVLGLPVGKRATVADQGVHAALLPMGDGEIELLEPADPAGGVARFVERKGEGLHHLCFETPDVSAALARARAAGLPLIDQSPRPGLAGMIAFVHPKASHGVLVELAQPLTPPAHPDPPSNGIRAIGIGTVYLAVKDLTTAATTFARNFQGEVGPMEEDARFGARTIDVSVGSSRLTLLSPGDPVSPVGCFLADRGEGLFGVCLRVADFEEALRHLDESDIPTKVHAAHAARALARVEPSQLNGVNLFLCSGASNGLPQPSRG
ncbi:MAG: methylmalonyl-CoA epimerase [candidate division NC10 bacterium]|nr:methylmalonyl-CoA epimerase [candidate division NC10 bacterium]